MYLQSTRRKITLTETQFRAAVAESNMQDIAGSINWIIDNISNPPVGSVQEALLTETQFQSIRGVGWVLADGRNVAGSQFHTITGLTVIPDYRGVHARGKNNGRSDGKENPGGDLALGASQGDDYKQHNHSATQTSPFPIVPGHTNNTTDQDIGNTRYRARLNIPGVTVFGAMSTYPGGTQQVVRCVTVNYFIRIN